MREEFVRTEAVLGAEGMERLARARVAVFGIGGVGGHAVDALARSGVGALDLFDDDVVSRSNINRQLVATQATLGRRKTDVMRAHILDINPDCVVTVHNLFYLPETADRVDLSQYDYIIDAVDTVSAKLELVCRAQQAGVPIICSMGAGNKLDPTRFEVADIYQTSVDPLARVMRRELKKRGIRRLKTVYSREEPSALRREIANSAVPGRPGENNKRAPGSLAFVPSVAGLILAGEVIKDLAGC
ncbi:MAG TPA: tRNA threonylcarbamoyladenosine dehydratase [Candidatus Butyricicoccus stercorigallinarum]|nr:tRNA threonylcarbamoyladenosine dehydratase [Candidatus Butyricicoccus stercorigallinarum]